MQNSEIKDARYEHGKIYKVIKVDEPNKFYIGSTCMPLSKRMACHRRQAKK